VVDVDELEEEEEVVLLADWGLPRTVFKMLEMI
jgi:hypothetical protein